MSERESRRVNGGMAQYRTLGQPQCDRECQRWQVRASGLGFEKESRASVIWPLKPLRRGHLSGHGTWELR